MILRAAVFVSLLVTGSGCLAPRADQGSEPLGPPPVRRLTPPSGLGMPPARKPEPVVKQPVVVAGHAEPEPSSNKLSAAQPPLPPRPAVPETKTGSEPPAAPGALPPVLGAAPSVGGLLALDEVLNSVERNYPLLRAIEQERGIAGGRLLSTMGAFDLNLTAGADGQGTTYDNFRSVAGVSQALPVGGLGAFAGYRNGYGDFPAYNLGQKTADGGEFRAGMTIPLFRDRAIDRPRANIQQARLDVALAEPVIERQRLDFQRAAARTYWNWVAAGQRLKVVESLVKLAVERDDQLKARVEAGPTANIERIDNQQNIALRNGVLVQAQRGFQQATIDLSLFLRNESGSPTLAGTNRLPTFPVVQPIDLKTFDASLQTAFDLRPEPRRLRLQRDKLAVELRLATNQNLPSVNAVVAASQDVGGGKSSLSGPNGLDRTTVSAGVAFQLPVQLRDARGRVMQAQAQLAQIDQQLRHAEDVVRAEVQDTFSALERAFEFYQQARKRVELTRLVAGAEREQLRLGRSDVLRVTLREQAMFDSEILEIGAQQDYFRALADFMAALGIGGK
jgi:outer membrane protein, heavy metal efflux system